MNGRQRLRAIRKELRNERMSEIAQAHLKEIEEQIRGNKPFDSKAWSWSEGPTLEELFGGL